MGIRAEGVRVQYAAPRLQIVPVDGSNHFRVGEVQKFRLNARLHTALLQHRAHSAV